MKWEYIGTGLAFVGIGVTLVLAFPPPWAPKMPTSLVHIGIVTGAVLIVIGLATAIIGVFPAIVGPRLVPFIFITVCCAAAVCGSYWLFWTAPRVESSPETQAKESLFKVTFYRQWIGTSMVSSGSAGEKLTVNNPIIELVRFDNIGSKPSAILDPTLDATIGGKTYHSVRYGINEPLDLGDPKRLSPKNDLFFRVTEALEPGHSLTGAMMFAFPNLEPGYLQDDSRRLTLSFHDIYGKEYSFQADFETKGGPPMLYPGVTYE